ncbi:MAG: hypothetical protein B7Z55_00420 [Planctomycetales bacterium 12-60-4]|nr:MAG: hypothetical protein B7Z55_00420 [Planctomycetales bacterium 12-60-4]
MLIFDAHLDLAYNAVDWNRDLEWSIAELRGAEAGMTTLGRQTATVTLGELRTAGIGLCVATLCARQEPKVDHGFGRITKEGCYAAAMAHREYYRAQERRGLMRIVTTKSQLQQAYAEYETKPDTAPLSFVLSMECADAVLDPSHVFDWYAQGVRAIGLTHYGVNRYGGGTNTEVGLFPEAFELLRNMEQLGMVLDLTHLSDPSFDQAVANFGGRIVASHQNARKWANWQRQFSDDQIRAVIARDGVIGAACDAIMLQEGWVRGVSKPEVTIDRVVDNIDYVCQMAGNCRNAGIGTDLDGGYGYEQPPADLNTIADLRRIPDLLERRGYSADDIRSILHGNWIRLYSESLPD